MEPIHYKTVFDVLDPGSRPWLRPALGSVGVVIAVLVSSRILRQQNRRVSARTLMIFDVGAALLILMAAGVLIVTVRNFARAYMTLRSGSALYVEGSVTHFEPMPPRTKGTEAFIVSGIPFYYSDNEVTAGFHQTVRFGGPMRQGLPVHIWYMNVGRLGGNEILKLEVAQE